MNYNKLEKLIKSDIIIFDFLVLENVKNDIELSEHHKNYFLITFRRLKEKELISDNYKITVKGKKLLEDLDVVEEQKESLHKILQDKLIELTGKKQIMMQKKYAFLLNERDLTIRLDKVCKKYSLNDKEKVKNILLNYIVKCKKADFNYVQTIEYYILKDNSSKLATDYTNEMLIEAEEKKDFTQPTETKNLF